MVTESLLSHPKVFAISPYPESIPVHDPSSQFLKNRLNIILPSMPRSPKLSHFLQISPPIFVHNSSVSHTCHMPHPSHYSGFNHPNTIWWRQQFMKLFVMQSFQSTVTSSPLDAYIFLCTLFSNTFSQCFFHNARHQVSHPYKMKGTIIILPIWSSYFLMANWTEWYWEFPKFSVFLISWRRQYCLVRVLPDIWISHHDRALQWAMENLCQLCRQGCDNTYCASFHVVLSYPVHLASSTTVRIMQYLGVLEHSIMETNPVPSMLCLKNNLNDALPVFMLCILYKRHDHKSLLSSLSVQFQTTLLNSALQIFWCFSN